MGSFFKKIKKIAGIAGPILSLFPPTAAIGIGLTVASGVLGGIDAKKDAKNLAGQSNELRQRQFQIAQQQAADAQRDFETQEERIKERGRALEEEFDLASQELKEAQGRNEGERERLFQNQLSQITTQLKRQETEIGQISQRRLEVLDELSAQAEELVGGDIRARGEIRQRFLQSVGASADQIDVLVQRQIENVGQGRTAALTEFDRGARDAQVAAESRASARGRDTTPITLTAEIERARGRGRLLFEGIESEGRQIADVATTAGRAADLRQRELSAAPTEGRDLFNLRSDLAGDRFSAEEFSFERTAAARDAAFRSRLVAEESVSGARRADTNLNLAANQGARNILSSGRDVIDANLRSTEALRASRVGSAGGAQSRLLGQGAESAAAASSSARVASQRSFQQAGEALVGGVKLFRDFNPNIPDSSGAVG